MARKVGSKARILKFLLVNPGKIPKSQDIVKDRSHGGKDELSNLRALCGDCNQGAKNLVQEPPGRTRLLGQVAVSDTGRPAGRAALSTRSVRGLKLRGGNSAMYLNPHSFSPVTFLRVKVCEFFKFHAPSNSLGVMGGI